MRIAHCPCKDVVQAQDHQSGVFRNADHRVSFARSCGPISEDGGIQTFQNSRNHALHKADVRLRGL